MNILVNICFLIFDERIKKDFQELKKIFDIYDDSQEVNLKQKSKLKKENPKLTIWTSISYKALHKGIPLLIKGHNTNKLLTCQR